MAENRRHIDDLFRDGLRDHISVPPPGAWDGISSRLAYGRRRAIYYQVARIAAAGLLLLGLGGGLRYILRQDSVTYSHPAAPAVASLPEASNDKAAGTDVSIAAVPGRVAYAWPGDRKGEPDHHRAMLTAAEPVRQMQLPALLASMPAGWLKPSHQTQRTIYTGVAAGEPVLPLIAATGRGRSGRWQASVMAAPNYSHRSLMESNGDNAKQSLNLYETGLVSVSGSLNISYRISDRLSFQSGLDLIRMGSKIKGLTVFDDRESWLNRRNSEAGFAPRPGNYVSNSYGPVVGNATPESYSLSPSFDYQGKGYRQLSYFQDGEGGSDQVHGFYFLQAPVMLRYHIPGENMDLVLGGGLGANFLVSNRVILKHEGENYDMGKTRVNNFGLSGIISVGMERRLGNSMKILFEPRFSHFISPLNTEGNLYTLPYAISFFGGLVFSL
jgi:hypothetical protein